jgi:hypothetical protein
LKEEDGQLVDLDVMQDILMTMQVMLSLFKTLINFTLGKFEG